MYHAFMQRFTWPRPLRAQILLHALAVASVALTLGCAGRVLEFERADEILKNDEYEKQVKVKSTPPKEPVAPAPVVVTPRLENSQVKGTGVKAKSAKATKAIESKKPKVPLRRQPEVEDTVGFEGRRPIRDPFRVGEKVTLNVTYFNVVAGTLEIMVKPMVEVNGINAYQFEVTAKSNSLFNRIYAVDDKAITFMSYDEMVPLSLSITLKESKQLAEARTFIDWKTNKATYWRKKVTKEKGEENKKLEWNVLPFSQNVVSALFYLRTFSWDVGRDLAFRVADEGKNIVFRGEVIRKEKLKTEIGVLDTLVLKPHLTVDGVFKPVGDILFWMTDDDRKFIVRIESKIKIGTMVAKLKSLEKGQD